MKQRGFTRYALTAAAFAVAASLAGCGATPAANTPAADQSAHPAWQKVLDAANAEGSINVYNVASEAQNTKLQAAWRKDHPGIKLNITRGATELPARVSAELETGSAGADAFLFTDPAWFTRNEAHLADLSNLPSVKGWSDKYWTVPNKAIIASTQPWTMIVWNTKTFPKGFKTWNDLLDPSVKGKLGSRGGVSPTVAGHLDFMETKLGEEYLVDLGKQEIKFYSSAVPLLQAVASGEIGVSNVGVPATLIDLKKKGAPIDWVNLEPGLAIQTGGAAFTKVAHPNAGVVFINWFMSEFGQAAFNGESQGGSGRAGTPGALELDGYTMLDATKYPPEAIPQWEAKFHRWFG